MTPSWSRRDALHLGGIGLAFLAGCASDQPPTESTPSVSPTRTTTTARTPDPTATTTRRHAGELKATVVTDPPEDAVLNRYGEDGGTNEDVSSLLELAAGRGPGEWVDRGLDPEAFGATRATLSGYALTEVRGRTPGYYFEYEGSVVVLAALEYH